MRRVVISAIMLLYMLLGVWGINWGLYLPLRAQHLFPEGSEWSSRLVAELKTSRNSEGPSQGADVDRNPAASDRPVILNDTDEKIAEIYVRYLLYTDQPDEMISLQALAEIHPAEGRWDPKMYQYGGLFLYPLGGLVKLASVTGLVRSGILSDYLQAPQEFAKFYVIGRLMVLAWGLFGVWAVYSLATHLWDWRAGALSALIYALSPVVVAMSHECKPHLPGAVLMIWATYWALRYIESGRVHHRFMLALCCGLALGMIPSSAWIFVLISVSEWLVQSTLRERIARSLFFGFLAVCIYGLVNPYVVINLLTDRQLLFSNVGNTAAMYHTGGWLAGLSNAWTLLVSGSSVWMVVGALVMVPALWAMDWRRTLILLVPAALMFAQFAAVGAEKPGEYSRFFIYVNVILGIVLSVGLYRFLVNRWYQGLAYGLALASVLAWPTTDYLVGFGRDGTKQDSRYQLAEQMANPGGGTTGGIDSIAVLRDPAPYAFPPTDFSRIRLVRLPKDVTHWPVDRHDWPRWLIVPLNGVEGVDVNQIIHDGYYTLEPGHSLPPDPTPITWADRPLVLLRAATE